MQRGKERASIKEHDQVDAPKSLLGKRPEKLHETSTTTMTRHHSDNRHVQEHRDKAPREQPAMSNDSSIRSGRTALAPQTPQPPARLSLVSNTQDASPRHILRRQSREVFNSPASSISFRRGMLPAPFPPHQPTSAPQLAAPSSGVAPNYAQGHNILNSYAVGALGHVYQQTPMPGPIPMSMSNPTPMYPMPSMPMYPMPPPQSFRPPYQVAESLQRTGIQLQPQPNMSYNGRVMASVGRPHGSIRLVQSDGNAVQNHLLRTRDSASSARTTWQHQQQHQRHQQPYPMGPPAFPRPSTLDGSAIPPAMLPSVPSRPR